MSTAACFLIGSIGWLESWCVSMRVLRQLLGRTGHEMLSTKDFNYDWQFMRDFFRLIYLRYLVTWFAIVPVAVVMLADAPSVVGIPMRLGQDLIIRLGLPFNWWILWFSSFLYVIAWSVFIAFGPRFIRRYTHYGAYLEWQHSQRWIIWEWYTFLKRSPTLDNVDVLIQKRLATECEDSCLLSDDIDLQQHGELSLSKPVKGEHETYFFFKHGKCTYRVGLGPSTANSRHAELFWELYGAYASSRPYVRMVTWSILYVAGILFLIVVAQNIWSVLQYLMSTVS